MGLFDKKYCDICGEKIGLLGNRKLEDGNLCKDCARKLSPFFSERRSSTVEDIKRQLAYRAENEKKLAGFAPSITFDGSKKVYIDPIGERFVVTGLSNWRSGNPDLIAFSQVLGVNTDIQENTATIGTVCCCSSAWRIAIGTYPLPATASRHLPMRGSNTSATS